MREISELNGQVIQQIYKSSNNKALIFQTTNGVVIIGFDYPSPNIWDIQIFKDTKYPMKVESSIMYYYTVEHEMIIRTDKGPFVFCFKGNRDDMKVLWCSSLKV